MIEPKVAETYLNKEITNLNFYYKEKKLFNTKKMDMKFLLHIKKREIIITYLKERRIFRVKYFSEFYNILKRERVIIKKFSVFSYIKKRATY
ncbi:hypothetical protein NUSPORA_01664 [Nucleospora cyclopteri]